jgi:hypothetical protein
MAVPTNKFTLVNGTPADPCFIEWIYKGHTVESVGVQLVLNILHLVKVGGVGVPTNLTSVFNLFDGIWTGNLSAFLANAYVSDAVTLRPMDDPTAPAVTFANNIAAAGGASRLPSFNSAVIRKNTYGRGRSYRGSNHWAPVADGLVLNDQLTAGGQVLLDAVATDQTNSTNRIDADGNLWSLFVLSPTLSDLTANPAAFTGSILQGAIANSVIGTMKRRKQGVGA